MLEGNCTAVQSTQELLELQDTWLAFDCKQPLTVLATGEARGSRGCCLARASLRRGPLSAGFSCEEVGVLVLGEEGYAPKLKPASKVALSKFKAPAKALIRIVAPSHYRACCKESRQWDSPQAIVSEMAQWKVEGPSTQASSLTGGNWQWTKHKGSDQLIGHLKVSESLAQALAPHSGRRGIFISLIKDLKTPARIGWTPKHEDEEPDDYLSRCSSFASARGASLKYRCGGGNDLGVVRKDGEAEEVRAVVVNVRAPKDWEAEGLLAFLLEQKWLEPQVLNKRGQSWLVKGTPPHPASTWRYIDAEDPSITVHVTKAQGKPPSVRETVPLRAPRAKLSEVSARPAEQRRGRAPPDAATGAGAGPRAGKDTQEIGSDRARSRSREKDTTESSKAPPLAPVFDPMTDALSSGWKIRDLGGDGDCGFRSLSGAMHHAKGTPFPDDVAVDQARCKGATIRTQCLSHIRKHVDRYAAFLQPDVDGGDMDTEDLEMYLGSMAHPRAWIDGIMIQAAAEKYGQVVVIWHKSKPQMDAAGLVTQANWQRTTLAPDWAKDGMPKMAKDKSPIVLRLENEHYTYMVPPEGSEVAPEPSLSKGPSTPSLHTFMRHAAQEAPKPQLDPAASLEPPEVPPRRRLKRKQHPLGEDEDTGHEPLTFSEKSGHRKNRISTVSWPCPLCKAVFTWTGHDKALSQKQRHMKLVHNTRLSAVGGSKSDKMKDQWEKNPRQFKSGAEATKKALLRAKQLKDQQRHDLAHATSMGLFPCIKKTWFCRRCLVKGNTRQITDKALAKACDLSEQKVAEFTEQATRVVQNARPRKDVQSEATRRRAAARKAQWRKDEGYTAEPASLPGKLNASLQMPRLNLKTSSRGGGIRKRPAAAVGAANAGVAESPPQNGPDSSWQRDLTEEGVERQPGPQREARRRRKAKRALPILLVWQLNVASFALRGWDLLAAAEANRVDIVVMQETRMTCEEAARVNNSLQRWTLFHQQEEPPEQRATTEGGVAVAVRRGIPAVKGASHCSGAGQWLRVALPGLHVTSAYRRQLSYEELADYNESLCADLASLGKTATMTFGDWNHDPLTDPLNVQAAGTRGMVHYPTLPNPAEGDEPQEPLPAPTRWASNRCIDWAVRSNVQASVKLLLDKWSDHKLLEWNIAGLSTGGLPNFKLRQTSDLRKPDNVSQKQWDEVIDRLWNRSAQERCSTNLSEWEQLSKAVEDVMREALRELGAQRRFTTKNYKGQVAAVTPDVRHHRPSPQGVPTVRTARLRRFGRRVEQYHRHPEPALSRSVLREAAFFECPSSPLEPGSLSDFRLWLENELRRLETAQRDKRLREWKQKMQQEDGPVWRWLAKAKKTEVTCGLKDSSGQVMTPVATMQTVEAFWRRHWPGSEDLADKLEVVENLYHEFGLGDQVRHPGMPPLSGSDLKRTLSRQKGKAAGPEGWRPEELWSWPAPALDLLAAFLNKVEQGSSWPRALRQWRQVHLSKPNKPAGELGSLRPISIGSAVYRTWSATRIRQLGPWLRRRFPDQVHGALPGRGVHTALLEPLAEIEAAQWSSQGSLRYLGSSDLSKAFDTMHGALSVGALRRLGVPQPLCDAWHRAWTSQERVLQLAAFCSQGAVTEVMALPQGDPASPAALTAPLVESLRRIQSIFAERRHGRSLFRLFLDDRSWYCAKRKTCLDVGRTWLQEVSVWGLGENKSKADFGVVGSAQARRRMQTELRRREQVGEVKLRPRLLGSRVHTNRAHSKPQGEERDRLVEAKKMAAWGSHLPCDQARKAYFLKQTAVAKAAAPTYVRREFGCLKFRHGHEVDAEAWVERGRQERGIRLREQNKDAINHALRDAWRARCWVTWLAQGSNRARPLAALSWPQAVMVGHMVSPAAFHVMSSPQAAMIPCPFCGSQEAPDFEHVMWVCEYFRPVPAVRQERLVRANLYRTSNYYYRLWCIFELAAFRKANSSGRTVLKPLYLEVGLLYVILANYIVVLVEEARVRYAEDEAWDVDGWWVLARVSISIPYALLLHGLRRLCHEKRHLIENIRRFELAKVSCRLKSDRDFIYAGIREWYGSEEAFEQYVRGTLYDELVHPFRRSDFPAVYWLMAMTTLFANQVDIWVTNYRNTSSVSSGLYQFRRFLALVVADPLTGINGMSYTFFLCDYLARPAAGMCDYGKTVLVWSVLMLGTYGWLLQSDIMAASERIEVTIAICAAQAVAYVFLRCLVGAKMRMI
ncbi:Pol [Symbiodinium natans]|uniref:Pol protein n=1 Tax=Symbiodinium natans TaxID=878477 RepID=A0A812PIY6_9DINO|nr:Pol [Symbiodinium natans]